jgi:hypothetical protein
MESAIFISHLNYDCSKRNKSTLDMQMSKNFKNLLQSTHSGIEQLKVTDLKSQLNLEEAKKREIKVNFVCHVGIICMILSWRYMLLKLK